MLPAHFTTCGGHNSMNADFSIYTTTFFFDSLVGGCTLGSTYALIALGYTMVFGIIQLLNFAHGEFYAAGGFMGVIALSYLTAQGYAETYPWLCLGGTFLMAMGYSAMLAMAVEKVAYSPLRNASRLALLLSALGMSIFLQNGFMLTQGGDRKTIPVPFENTTVVIGDLSVNLLQLMIMVVTITLLIALNFLVFKTRLGRAMRATAQDKVMAALVGINANNIISTTFAIGAGLAAAAGIMVGMNYGGVQHVMGFVPGVKAFAAAVLGGIGNITGAMIGGFIIGMVEVFAASYIPHGSEYKDVWAFIILIAVLYFRPTGIMGENVDDTRV